MSDTLPGTPVAPAVERARGRLMDAKRIVKIFFTDSEGAALVTKRWVTENIPYPMKLSHSRIAWREKDVEEVLAEAQRLGIPTKDVKLAHLEPKE